MNTPPPTPPTPPDDPLTDRAKGITKGIGYLIASTLDILFLIYALSAKMRLGLSYFVLASICIGGLFKGFAYILKGNQKAQEEEAERKAEREAEQDLIQKWGCLKLIFIIIGSLIVILALSCLFG